MGRVPLDAVITEGERVATDDEAGGRIFADSV